MEQDVNKIIDTVAQTMAADLAEAKKQIAILAEENERLKSQLNGQDAE